MIILKSPKLKIITFKNYGIFLVLWQNIDRNIKSFMEGGTLDGIMDIRIKINSEGRMIWSSRNFR